jgi:hypothetical protein
MSEVNEVEQFSVDRTDTALVINGDLPYELWVEQGKELNRIGGAIMWWLGDWWAFGEKKYGERVEAAKELELDFGTCRNAGWVANKVEASRRRDVLSWSHHYEVCSLDTDEQEEFLARWEKVAVETGKAPSRKVARTEVKTYKLNKKNRPEIAGSEVEPSGGGWHQLGPHWLYCGDSTDPEFIERCAGARFAFADPPYNADKAEWDNNFVWKHDYLAEVAPIVAVTPGIASLADFMSLTGMPYRWTLSAEITNGMTRGALGFGNWIAVALFAADESLYRNAKDVLHIAAGTGDDQGGIHPSRKPIRLINELITLFTNKDDLIVDPFLGSGTTLIAADKLGRRCIGAELDPTYCAHIIARYEESR